MCPLVGSVLGLADSANQPDLLVCEGVPTNALSISLVAMLAVSYPFGLLYSRTNTKYPGYYHRPSPGQLSGSAYGGTSTSPRLLADSNGRTHVYALSNANSLSNGHTQAHVYAVSNSYAHADLYAYTHAYGNPYAHGHAHA